MDKRMGLVIRKQNWAYLLLYLQYRTVTPMGIERALNSVLSLGNKLASRLTNMTATS